MKTNKIWGILEEEYHKNKSDFGFLLQNYSVIQQTENILNVKFSDQYLLFLKKFNGAILEGHILCGITKENKKEYLMDNIVDKTNFYRNQNWPDIENWYIVSDDGFGNPIGIDPEGKVWLSDHDSGFEQVKLADDFEEFLYKLYTDTLYE